MASGGSSGRTGSGFRTFDFGSDDVLCSYDDYESPDPSNGKRSEPSGKDLHESRRGRPLPSVYGQQDEYPKEEIISAVEKCMKKYADNLLHYLEGISGRLSQLELYCYKVERSVGEFRADMIRDQSEVDTKLKSLEKHLQEVHRSVQIIRDKQELAETQKELAKFQVVQKESTTPTHSQKIEGVTSSVSELKRHDDSPDISNQQLALALPHQTVHPTSLSSKAPEHNQLPIMQQQQQPAPPTSLGMPQDHYVMSQSGSFYPQQRQALPLGQQSQGLQPELQYMQPRAQMQDLSVQAPLPPLPSAQQPNMVNQTHQAFPQYQQQWPQPSSQLFPQQVVAPTQQTPTSQAPQIIRPQAPPTYPTYPPQQPANPTPETIPGSMQTQSPYSLIPRSGGNSAEAVPFGYGASGSTISQTAPPHSNLPRQPQHQAGQSSYGPPLSKGSSYVGTSPYMQQPNVQGYGTIYSTDGSRGGVHSQNYPPAGNYLPPNNSSALQSQQLPSHLVRSHPYGEIIEKAVSMGYPRDQVVSVVNRMAESGQPMDFNSLLDRLSTLPSSGAPRGWSG